MPVMATPLNFEVSTALLSDYDDFMPPDNNWFGQKNVMVSARRTVATRSVWFFFNACF